MDKLLLGLSTTAIGMLVVFFGLVILIACIYVMTSITGRRKKEAAPPEKAAPAPAEEIPQEEEGSDLELVAAITAAIAAVWQDEGKQSGFVVRRIRRSQNGTARAHAARDEQIYSRL